LAEYKTKQKEELLSYLRETGDTPQSVEDIFAALQQRGGTLGQSTVYRLVKKLSAEGTLKCFSENKRFLYQLVAGEDCHHHLHLKCTQCGRLLHMGHSESERLIEDIYGANGFAVSEEATTLFGCCGECAAKTAVNTKNSHRGI
jgi:Fur family ferric uptake transcriptional regulator